MNEEFVEAVAQGQHLREGQHAAEKVLTDALIATLIQAFPPLGAQLQSHIDGLATIGRQDLVGAEELAHRAFENRIRSVQDLIEVLTGK